ncbi:MAG: NAD(P)H-quinone oxidoreductase subunit 3 [Nitrospinaceae bacterium]|nr:NADH-quinone oxidoreductase subunit A [Nitrospinaceae bacterium]NIR54631.1 NADH-quinone oxidoreductase subunit A [Nitrospinaceae bacterium]NIS85048.1 NADH-quinone oxidoreductase subunit A [Nitrospinaceae bacterium]NIT81864.1 NADH-quinone oxidoreductase subunit A [Nitrospinaceae bacterium]NIU44129.1 NADH-quinone oxidoreductase subunit A [Nitrospinaceae bacterium]
MSEYLFVIIFAVVALVIIGGALVLSTILGPKNSTPEKNLPYECGMLPSEEAKGRFPVRFATIAMLFIIFDIEVVFMYPWAVALDELKLFGLVEMVIFVVILAIAYVYIWGRGGLEWD